MVHFTQCDYSIFYRHTKLDMVTVLKAILLLALFCFASNALAIRTHQLAPQNHWQSWDQTEKKSENSFVIILIIFLIVSAAMIGGICLLANYNRDRVQAYTVTSGPYYGKYL